MPRSAAFFDLDRTLLPGGSGPVFAASLKSLGVKTPSIPGQQWMFRLFDAVGESFVVMQLARSASTRVKGLERAMVQASAELAAETLLERVQPHAPALLAEHRLAGDLLVLATTSPFDLVTPFARRLGFDAVVATRFEEHEGVYTGAIDGEFCWGPGKFRLVRAWAEANDVDLSASSAYSDSIFDTPLLSAVGRPVAVNPDPRLRALAAVRRWPVRSLTVPIGVPTLSGMEPLDIVRRLTRPGSFPGVRFRIEGVENIPTSGPAIVAANHRSYFDPVAIALGLAKAGRNGRFLGKKEVFDAPVVGQVARALGGIRVDRGTGSEEPLRRAASALHGGEVVVILPQGTIPRGDLFDDPVLTGKTGVARLARMTPDVPVIPLGVWGTENVWPRTSKVPHLLQLDNPPEVIIRFGPPAKLTYGTSERSVRDDTQRVMEAIMDLLPNRSPRVRAADGPQPGGSGPKPPRKAGAAAKKPAAKAGAAKKAGVPPRKAGAAAKRPAAKAESSPPTRRLGGTLSSR